MNLGNMGALALSSETAKYMFSEEVCQRVCRNELLISPHDLGPASRSLLLPRCVISHNRSAHQRQVVQSVFVKPDETKAATTSSFRVIDVGSPGIIWLEYSDYL
jgi:hypothetical protein